MDPPCHDFIVALFQELGCKHGRNLVVWGLGREAAAVDAVDPIEVVIQTWGAIFSVFLRQKMKGSPVSLVLIETKRQSSL